MIQRLNHEHINFESTFKRTEKCISENAIKDAIKIIHDLSESIIKHAVEEEARLMRVIMQNAKEESSDSIKIMQEHNWVVDFLSTNYKILKMKLVNNNTLSSNNNYNYNKKK